MYEEGIKTTTWSKYRRTPSIIIENRKLVCRQKKQNFQVVIVIIFFFGVTMLWEYPVELSLLNFIFRSAKY